MKRCLELAVKGRYKVFSNPMVGCVIVQDDEIISEGYHACYGGNHAERNAILQVKEKAKLEDATLYVNLEPCSHYGKTPPCADLIIEHKLSKVVVGMQDPNPLVSGKGIEQLRNEGVLVLTHVLESECRELNKRFICLHEKKRPYITLKWARTSNGFMARLKEDPGSPIISNEVSARYVHKLRAENNAILIGAQTANRDDPLLNLRYWEGRDPLKLILSPLGSLQRDLKLFSEGNCRVYVTGDQSYPGTTVKCSPREFLAQVMQDLYEQNIHSVLVEGGRTVLQAFLEAGLWDEIHEIIAPVNWDSGIKAPDITLKAFTHSKLSGDQLNVYKNES